MASYQESLGPVVASLAGSIAAVLDQETEGIANPVQDYLTTRSPLTCGESRYVDSLTDTDEEEMVRRATSRRSSPSGSPGRTSARSWRACSRPANA